MAAHASLYDPLGSYVFSEVSHIKHNLAAGLKLGTGSCIPVLACCKDQFPCSMGAAVHYPLPAITTLKNGVGFRSIREKLNRFLGLGPCLGNKGAGMSVTLCSSDSANSLLKAGERGW